MRGIEDFLARIYDRTQRVQPQSAHRTVQKWVIVADEPTYDYPYKWAESGDWTATKNTKWGAPGTVYGKWGATWPTYIAVGLGSAGGTPTALVDELERVPVIFTYDWGYGTAKVRYSAKFNTKVGVGDWTEIGLFYDDAIVSTLDNCDGTAGWTSEQPSVKAETVIVRAGDASVSAYGGTATVSFKNTNHFDAYTNVFAETDKFQFWYYIDDVSRLTGTNISFYFSSNATTPTSDSYRYDVPISSLVDGWNWFSKVVNTYNSKVGVANVNNIVSFQAQVTKSAATTECLDKIRIFKENGTLWEYNAFTHTIEKQYGEVRWSYWYLQFDTN